MQSTKSHEGRVRRAAKPKGYPLRKSRTRDRRAEDYGLYVLVGDSAGNRRPGAQAPISAFAGGEGMTLDDVEAELAAVPSWR
jgi:hypothetical protein